MLLINYDFYDLYALITFFRNNTEKYFAYDKAVQKIIYYIDLPSSNNGLEANIIRKILKPYFNAEDNFLSWVLVENKYTANIGIIKDKTYYDILSAVFKEMQQCINDSQRFYLLCDASHNIPLLLADTKNPKKAIKIMIKDYQKNYNKEFLLKELKKI